MTTNCLLKAMCFLFLGLGPAVAAVAEEDEAMDSVQSAFMRDCKSWFWDCDCVANELFPAAVRSLKDERFHKKLVALKKACEDNSWESLKFHLNRVLTTEEFKKLGLEPPARGAVPAVSPCEVARKLEGSEVGEFIDAPHASHIWLEASSRVACRNGPGIRASALRSCSQFANSQAYDCDCYADRYRDFWMAEATAFSSGLDIQVSSEAMMRCQRKK